MNVAIFVEGTTELEFVATLIAALCGRRDISYEFREQFGGKLRTVRVVNSPVATTRVLLVNCHSDEQVKTRVRDSYPSLVAAGYNYVIGLRDVYPRAPTDLPRIQASLQLGLPLGAVPVVMHLAIMEVESWFLDELTHFPRIDPLLTAPYLLAAGFDVENTLGQDWGHPSETLDNIYRLAGKRYRKKLAHIQRTITALSAEEMYVTVRRRSSSFDRFVSELEQALF